MTWYCSAYDEDIHRAISKGENAEESLAPERSWPKLPVGKPMPSAHPLSHAAIVVDFKLKRLNDNCLEMTKGKTSPNKNSSKLNKFEGLQCFFVGDNLKAGY